MYKIAMTAAVLGLTATAAFAQTPTSFVDVDADGNGELSLVELQVVWPDLTDVEFSGADVDVSGGLSADEINSLQPTTLPADPVAAPAAVPDVSVDAPVTLTDPGPNAEND